MKDASGQAETQLKYALLGSGRLAKHLGEYFRLLGIPHLKWSRKNDPFFNTVDCNSQPDPAKRLKEVAQKASCLILLVSDDSIQKIIEENKLTSLNKTLLHCSGSLSLNEVQSVHPLMTFAGALYDLESYKGVPFITEKGRMSLDELIPELPNPSYAIPSSDKALYHAYCVASGNFTALLWGHVFQEFPNRLNLPQEILFPYMQRVAHNLRTSPQTALTGPLIRGDRKTIEKNLNALKDDPIRPVYEAFVKFCDAKRDK